MKNTNNFSLLCSIRLRRRITIKQLLILSGKGGTGKTTLAGAIIKLNQAKVFADCDVDAPNLHLLMNRNKKPITRDFYGLPKAEINAKLCIQCDLCRINCNFDAITPHEKYSVDPYACEGCGVCVKLCPVNAIKMKPSVAGELKLYKEDSIFSTAQLKMGSGNSGKLVSAVKKQMKDSAQDAPLCIIDGSPGIGCPVIASISGVDMVLIVTEPSITGISDLKRIVQTANRFQVKTVICINKHDTNLFQTRRIESYCKKNQIPIAGSIPYDDEVITMMNQGKSIIEIDTKASRAIKEVYEKVIELLEDNQWWIKTFKKSLHDLY